MSEPLSPARPDPDTIARAFSASAPHEPTGDVLNLSRRPFLNSRPVIRTALLLWLLGLVLLVVNISSFWNYLSGSADKRAQIDKGEREISARETAVRQLEVRLDAYDLTANNLKVDFLNEKIAQRTFSWSLLLERVAEVLPNDVRLEHLQPLTGGNSSRSASSASVRRLSAAATAGTVPLSITGFSRNNDALLRFQSNLFAHPAFTYPNVSHQELSEDTNLIQFDLSAQYIPGGTTPTVLKAPEPATPLGGVAAKTASSTAVPLLAGNPDLTLRRTPPPKTRGGVR